METLVGDTLPNKENLELFRKQINQAVHGYNLKPKIVGRELGYTTSSGNISKYLIQTMNKWFIENKSYYPTLKAIWNRTYDMIQFIQR